jgi:hypothetical protein
LGKKMKIWMGGMKIVEGGLKKKGQRGMKWINTAERGEK